MTGGTTSTDFPIIVGAADSTHNGMSDVFVSELNNTGSTLLYSTFLGGSDSEGGFDIAVDTSGGVYVTGHTFSLNYPTTAGAFDTVWNGDMLVFWGDAFVSKLGSVSSPPSTPPIPAAPALLSPSNGASEAQPINFQWAVASGAASYTIQIDDSSAFTAPLVREQQNITTLLIYATSGLSTAPHFWRVRGVNFDGVPGPWSAVRSVNPGVSPPPPGVGSIDINPTTIVGGNSSSGTVVLSTGAPFGGALINLSSSNPSVASVPATVTAPANSFVGSFAIATSPVAANTTVTITASYNGTSRSGTLTVTPAGAPQGLLSNARGHFADRRRLDRAGQRAAGRGGANRCGRVALEQQLVGRQRAVDGDGAGRQPGRGLQRLDERGQHIDDGDDYRHLQRRDENGDPHGVAGRAATAATAECHADGDGERTERRAGDVESHGDQRHRRQQRLGVVRDRHADHVDGIERTRRNLFGGVLERGIEAKDVHVHARRERFGERQRAIARGAPRRRARHHRQGPVFRPAPPGRPEGRPLPMFRPPGPYNDPRNASSWATRSASRSTN